MLTVNLAFLYMIEVYLVKNLLGEEREQFIPEMVGCGILVQVYNKHTKKK